MIKIFSQLNRQVFVLLLSGVLCVTTAKAQQRDSKRASTPRDEQASFNLEAPVRHPVPIPSDVLRRLRQDEKVLKCLTEANVAPAEIPSSWFAASAIDLNDDKLTDLVVKPENSCLLGANIGPFWVFRNMGQGYMLALRVDALQLDVLPTRTREHRNIRTSSASARRVFTRTYRFNGENYQASRR